ncbi:MAG: phosphotriesterase [Faecalicatena sp.]|uniref:phosphotriesterase family protein n=1 Tax=Faecalicatena sp. TaxID=2005360 RepID=UPI00258D3570|nr:phosphotriesterase [Faecalicatena sp.]MCI6464600.1 phosphotriesterase [Faecalicatena sp.]MDY5620920.1 phosphotriesterase [Lachnospiraceae bacterium]
MGYIETVTGRVEEENIGHCQPHEHVYITQTPALLTNPELRLNNLAASIKELQMYKKAGGNTLVDANPLATGRDALALKSASEVSGVQVIACTGYHIPIFYREDHWIWSTPEEELEELFVRELTEGMFLGGCYGWPSYQTDIRAGLVKAMLTSEGVSGRTEVLLKAAGRAAAKTGTSLMLHTEYGKGALEAIQLLKEHGLKENRILICHVDRQVEELSIHEEIAASGVFMEYDTITLFEFHDNESEIRMLRHMIDKGYLDQILISTDPTADRLKNYEGRCGMDYILTTFIPALKKQGFTDQEIIQITQENPKKALCR